MRFALSLVALTLCSSLAVGCTVGNSQSRPRPGGNFGAAQGERPPETFAPGAPRQRGQALLVLPGSTSQQMINYDVVNGMAVYEGDILLGPANSVAYRYGMPHAGDPNVKSAVAVKSKSFLWPNGDIPYEIGPSVSPAERENVMWAVSHLSETELNLRPRLPTDSDYLVFVDGQGSCSSYIGRIGGGQEVLIGQCGRGGVAHEVLHAAGFFHEQTRADRDSHVTIRWENISPGHRDNFEQRTAQSQDVGAYDYGSLMHYTSRAFSMNGQPTIEPKIPGTPLGQREGLSSLDRAGITFLYGSGVAPSPIPGLPFPIPGLPFPGTAQPAPTQPTPGQPAPPPPGPGTDGSFAGEYSSERGQVSCTQTGPSVSCSYPGGSLLCVSRGGTQMDCAWSGGGQGRAIFNRQSNGVLAGTFGDFLSTSSRGGWSLTPMSAGSAGPPPAVVPGPAPAPGPAGPAMSLTGSYNSSRGPMECTEDPSTVRCTFQEQGSNGRLDCQKDASGLQLSCSWATAFPRPGAGMAALSRANPSDRNLTGTWGYFAPSGGGQWDASPR